MEIFITKGTIMVVYLGQISGAVIGGGVVAAILTGDPAKLGICLMGVVIGLLAQSMVAK